MDAILNDVTQIPIEELGLSVRTRRALRRFGCGTVGDVLQLDLSAPVRGLGQKSKEELLTRLEEAGFSHPASGPRSEIAGLERNLKRLERHMDMVIGLASKELRIAHEQIERLKARYLVAT